MTNNHRTPDTIRTELQEVIHHFGFKGKRKDVGLHGNGHIHDTYKLKTDAGSYMLQRFNHNVFKDPQAVTQNILKVTEHLKEKFGQNGGNPHRQTLTPLQTREGDSLVQAPSGYHWRAFDWIPNTQALEKAEHLQQYCSAAQAYSHFIHLLDDFPLSELSITIPDFHHTPKRFLALQAALNADPLKRSEEAEEEVGFALDREKDTNLLIDLFEAGQLPERITHNDTKLNNVLFDKASGEAVCVIDLDTVMPGLSLYDFGDCVRSSATTAAEDETDLDKVQFDMAVFDQIAQGFITAGKDMLIPLEIEHLAFSARLITFEIGIRFLTDFLQGDTYFKTKYADHNLVRARTQFKLVQEMETNFQEMQEIVFSSVELAQNQPL